MINAKDLRVLETRAEEEVLISYLGRLNYSYAGRYMVTGVIRRDGTSKLRAVNRWEIYPSASVGWNISEEAFMQPVDLITDLKLRASWGVIGNLGGLPSYPSAIPLSQTRAWFGESPEIGYGYAENELSNANLRWEESVQKNIGLDFGLLQGHISGSFDYFDKTNTKMLFKKVLPGSAGTPDGQFINAGKVRNNGIELGLTYKKSQGLLTFDITGNVAKLNNEIRSLTDGNTSMVIDNSAVRNLPRPNIHMVGDPYAAFYGYHTAGIFQTDAEAAEYVNDKGVRYQPFAKAGDFKFVDEDGDGSINDTDRRVLGNPFPDLTYSLNGNVYFKNFDLNIFFQGVHGNSIFNAVKGMGMNATYGYNLLADVKNAWTPENGSNSIPRLSITDANNNFGRISDFYIEDASFLRLKSVTMGYTFKTPKLSDLQVRLYLTGQNLFTITDYSGMDPEVGMSSNGLDVALYPLSRVYMAGINVKF
jgi:TonB-linked SusC/RagA family outer membrane protein